MDYQFLHPYRTPPSAPFTRTHATIANLDASGGEEILDVGCVDRGGNNNVRFLSKDK